jgi:hypothetical protein
MTQIEKMDIISNTIVPRYAIILAHNNIQVAFCQEYKQALRLIAGKEKEFKITKISDKNGLPA